MKTVIHLFLLRRNEITRVKSEVEGLICDLKSSIKDVRTLVILVTLCFFILY